MLSLPNKTLLILTLLFSFSFSSQLLAQGNEGNPDYWEYKKQKEEEKKKEKDENDFSSYTLGERMYWGGSLSASFGTLGSYIDISPILGYNLTEKWSFGVGATYKFFGGRNSFYNVTFSTSVWGGSVFTRLLLGEKFLAQAELEYLNTDSYDVLTNSFVRKFIPVGAAGLGYRNEMGFNRYFYFLMMYDFIRDRDSPYPFSPIIMKIGAVFPISEKY